jgi:pimeloyl-ACP methyl ester carboxylesterase
MHVIERAGHWVQQEDPATLNRLLVDWLRRRFG